MNVNYNKEIYKKSTIIDIVNNIYIYNKIVISYETIIISCKTKQIILEY